MPSQENFLILGGAFGRFVRKLRPHYSSSSSSGNEGKCVKLLDIISSLLKLKGNDGNEDILLKIHVSFSRLGGNLHNTVRSLLKTLNILRLFGKLIISRVLDRFPIISRETKLGGKLSILEMLVWLISSLDTLRNLLKSGSLTIFSPVIHLIKSLSEVSLSI